MIKKLPDEETNSTAPGNHDYKDVRAFDNHGYIHEKAIGNHEYVKDNKVNYQRSFFILVKSSNRPRLFFIDFLKSCKHYINFICSTE